MALGIRKPIDSPETISILFPTRARPHYLPALFDSLEETTTDTAKVDVWVFVDQEDPPTQEFFDTYRWSRYSFKIFDVLGPRTWTQGEMYNILRDRCTTNPGIYMFATDKILFATEAWDELVRDVYSDYPDRILFAYAVDPHTGPEFGSYGFISAEWANVLGRVMTEYFPFWYDDRWINEVGMMIQRRVKLDMQLGLQHGKGRTHRMRDLLFWYRFFLNLMDEREGDAEALRRTIHSEGSAGYGKNVEAGKIATERLMADRLTDEDLVFAEEFFSAVRRDIRRQADRGYRTAKRRAERHLRRKMDLLFSQGRTREGLAVMCDLAMSYPLLQDVQHFRVIWQGRFRKAWRGLTESPLESSGRAR